MPKKQVVNLTRLEKLMREREWGIGELAAYSGVKYDTVYSLVKGRRLNVGAGVLKPIADALRTTVDYLLGESDAEELAVAPTPPTTVRQLANVAERLSELRREELLRIASTFEKMEAEEAQRKVPDEVITDIISRAKTLGPHITVETLVTALRIAFGDQPGRRLVDLGVQGNSSPLPGQHLARHSSVLWYKLLLDNCTEIVYTVVIRTNAHTHRSTHDDHSPNLDRQSN